MSAWTPLYADVGAELFVRNALAAIETHQLAAFAYASPNEELGEFAAFNNSRRINQKWPVVWCAPPLEETPVSSGGGFLECVVTLEVGIEIVFGPDEDGNGIGYRLMRYAKAVRAIVLAMTAGEWAVGLPEDGKWGALNVELTPTRYDDFFNERQSIYKKTALMAVKVSLLEGMN